MRAKGFTLIELSVVIFIIALVLASGIGMLSTYMTARYDREARDQASQMIDAVYAFATTNGRLPCPTAFPPAAAVENCALTYGAFPAAMLGLQLNDPWGHPVRYAVDLNYVTNAALKVAFTTNPPPGLAVCNTSTGNTGLACAVGATVATSPAVIIMGGPSITGSVDETENTNANHVYVQRDRVEDVFDDSVFFTSPYILFGKMIQGQTLP